MSEPIDQMLDFAIKNKQNILLSGKHGVGKTARVIDAFKRHKIKFLYFSASTMDPFTDFVGVPYKTQKLDDNGQRTGDECLGFLRPEAIEDESIEALFFDEYNRSPKKVRNAVMELIQFKSINGRKFPNIKYVWTAINPDDDEDERYDVEMLDGAQLDRFHMQINVPYKLSNPFFLKRYPNGQGNAAIQWWNKLSKEEKNYVSPRRLDYAVNALVKGKATADIIRTFFPEKINVSDFIRAITDGSLEARMADAYKTKNTSEIESIMNGSEINSAIDLMDKTIGNKRGMYDFVVDASTDETLVKIINAYKKCTRDHMPDNKKHEKRLLDLLALKSASNDLKNKLVSCIADDSLPDDLKVQKAKNPVDDESVLDEGWTTYN